MQTVAQLYARPGLQNFGWLALDKGLRLVVGVLVGSWVARYLGAAQFGLFSYATAWLAIVAGVASMGLDALVVRDLIKAPAESPRLLGTVVTVRGITTVLSGCLVLLTVLLLRPDGPTSASLIAVLLAGAVFQSLDSGELWFQSQLQMRRLVVPRLSLFLLVNLLKIVLVLRGAGLPTFIVLGAVELAGSGLLTWWFLRRNEAAGSGKLRWDRAEARRLLAESWPLALSGLMVTLYMRIAQLILSALMGDAALGLYAAGTRIAEAPYFLPTILASSILPSLLRSQQAGEAEYRVARLRYFRLSAILAYAIAAPLSALAPQIINLLYGPDYERASSVLALHAWSLVFVFSGVARSQHILNKRLTMLPLQFTIWGLIINLSACFLLIPKMGATGAALAVLLAQVGSSLITSFIYPSTRYVGREQVLALLTPWRYRA